MISLLSECDYGNGKTSGKQPFWIHGDLAISTDEQVDFLRKLHSNELPFRKSVMDTVKELIMVDRTEDWTLYGKTGCAQSEGTNTGWFVGWLDTEDNVYFFATNIESRNSRNFGQARRAITMDVLRQLAPALAEYRSP